MDAKKYNRSIILQCPTCGCERLYHDEDNNSSPIECGDCGRVMTKDELISDNGSLIEHNAETIGKEILDDLTKDLRKSFKNFK